MLPIRITLSLLPVLLFFTFCIQSKQKQIAPSDYPNIDDLGDTTFFTKNFQKGLDNITNLLDQWNLIEDTLSQYRDSLSLKAGIKARIDNDAKKFNDTLLNATKVFSITEAGLATIRKNVVQFSESSRRMLVLERTIKTLDSAKKKNIYDSLFDIKRKLKVEIDQSRERTLKVIISSRLTSGHDSIKPRIAREVSEKLFRLPVSLVNADTEKTKVSKEIEHLNARIATLKMHGIKLQQLVEDSGKSIDKYLSDSLIPNHIMNLRFLGKHYRVFIADTKAHEIRIIPNTMKRTLPIKKVWDELSKDTPLPIMACNAGMYDPDGSPVGLLVSNKQASHKINDDTIPIQDNFHMYPNGIFMLDSSAGFRVVDTRAFKESRSIVQATQSGPLLLKDNEIHKAFGRRSQNLNIRNGIGVIDLKSIKTSRCAIVISDDRVNFFEFASFFKYGLGCKNALYLDGAISQMVGRYENGVSSNDLKSTAGLGPILAVIPKKHRQHTTSK